MADFDTEYTDIVVCPYCGNEDQDVYEYSEGESKCPDCGKEFMLSIDTVVHYTTTKIDNDSKPYTGEPEHPDGYDGPCGCDTCLSYGEMEE